MSNDKRDDQVDFELRRLGKSLDAAVGSSAVIAGAKNAAIADAVLAFQQLQQAGKSGGISWLRVSRLVTTAAVTSCLMLFVARHPSKRLDAIDSSQSGVFSMDELTVALNSFSEDFSAEFPTSELLGEVGAAAASLDGVEAGFLDNTTLEDLDDEFEAT